MTHRDLVALGLRWLGHRCSVAFAEFATSASEAPDVIGWRGGGSILIECKVSSSDFRADSKKIFRRYSDLGMGRERYFLVPAGLINPEGLPYGWGLLWATDKGRVYKKLSSRVFPVVNLPAEIKYLTSMLRRAQIRLGDKQLSDWLHIENMNQRLDEEAVA